MILISIQPFALKKMFFLVATLLCLSSAICVADSLFMTLHPPAPEPLAQRTIQPTLVASPPFDAGFATDSGAIPLEILALNPAIDWLRDL